MSRRPALLIFISLAAFALASSGCGAIKRAAYAGFGRDQWQQPARVVESLDIAPGNHVADLGAGGGYFTFRLADAVGSEGRVYAVDIDPDMTDFLRDEARERGYAQIQVIEATPEDARLPTSGVDLVLLTNAYHHMEDRVDYFRRLSTRLRRAGRIAVIEFSDDGSHATDPERIRSEMQRAGLRRVANHTYLERQSFQIFTPEGE